MKDQWTQYDTRDKVVDFVRDISLKTDLAYYKIVSWIGVGRSKFYEWRKRYGKANEHNGLVPRDWWLEDWEKKAIVDYYIFHPFEGYRRLTYMMIDEDIVAVSPTTVYRTLKQAELLFRRNLKASKKGTGFDQPEEPHQHWHMDIMYVNICGTFYYLCSILDGYSRYIVHWELRESMKEEDVEIVLQCGLEKFPGVRPRIISDNGPQFIAKDFKEFIRFKGMTHVRTRPYYPQSNGKIERMQGTLKRECIRPKCPKSFEDALRIMTDFVVYYNNKRLHSATGYIAPKDMLDGRQSEIHAERDRKLEKAREQRRLNRQLERKATIILTDEKSADTIIITR